MTERYAIYYAPAEDHPLWGLAQNWFAGVALKNWPEDPVPDAIAFEANTASARRYGFHATLKPPMRLAPGVNTRDLFASVRRFAEKTAPVAIGKLELRNLGGFLALMPANQSADLSLLAANIVAHFEPYREALTEEERQKRLAGGLTQHQMQLLDQYGYPYVMDEFRMHLTLTDRLDPEARTQYFAAASQWFAPVLGEDFVLDRLAIYHEPEPGAPFTRLIDFELNGASK